jgi:hypothetical protein
MTQRKSKAVPLGALAVSASLALTGCGTEPEPDPTHQSICMDTRTQERLPDDQCDEGDEDDGDIGGRDDDGDGHSSFFMFIGGTNTSYPAVGKTVTPQQKSAGQFGKPSSGSYVRGGVPAGGSQVAPARGGFGGGTRVGSSGG